MHARVQFFVSILVLGLFVGNNRAMLSQELCHRKSNALCPSHQQRHISSLQAATLQHELGHSRRGFRCFLLPTRLFRFKDNTSRASYKSSEESQGAGAIDPLPYAEAILVQGNASWWQQQFPRRWVIVLLCFASFLLCNMDRVNMSVAILPMSQQYNWNSATVGLIQSSFFWGYLLTQILGGIWADKYGGKVVLGFGVVWWSIATVMTPIAAKLGLPFLLVVRAFMGIGEGVAMPAMNNMLSKWIPVSERSRSLALVYSGMYLGSVTGLGFSPMLIQNFGWPSVFYSFGSLGSIWFLLWLKYAYSSPKDDPELSEEEKKIILGGSKPREPVTVIPWKLILSKPPVWALIISHFCHNWGTFILLTWMPTYYNQVLKFNLTESGLLCVLPWFTMAVLANVGGWIADTLVSRGLSITSVRKIMQSIGFLGPAFFLTQLSRVKTPAMAVLCMACSQGADAFSQSGLYSNHQDIGPRYAGVLLGLSNTAGVLAGVFGTAATGYILQRGSWDDVFKVAVGLYLIGTLVWNLFATGEKVLD
ncbi:PREDICTED: ascorbate transporter, chloroplastic-like isoform X2 [Brassica oleracea var. oleracea]|uniref:ascorbate transporter, chloroplastic-like isoform X2 n=1 Tax=Brassica oleracea var. oleracea TaxID=109376 RepID=UPI0006A6CFF2|nr:PREDICTED: ascorbate transporter, chloroplastic-like isoform X2 [Brassica oleracea var. oleracea]